MTEAELLTYIKEKYPRENEKCEWKEFSSLKHSISSHPSDDVISYVSAISNNEGGSLVIGVEDNLRSITGIYDTHSYTPENLPLHLIKHCFNLGDISLKVEEFITNDSKKVVWVIHIPKHLPRKPVLAHKTAWQRIGDSLTKLTAERELFILNEPLYKVDDWSSAICEDATVDDLDAEAILVARENYKNKFPEKKEEIDGWKDETFLNKAKITIRGKVTRTAILLLGKSESEF